MILTAALAAFAAPSSAHAASALARTTAALTGLANPSQLKARSVCQPATPTRVTCYAQMLVNSSTGAPVHPRHVPPAPGAGRFAGARSVAAGSSQPQPGSPAYMQQAYDLSYLSQTRGAGDTIAIVDAYNNPNAEADLATYRASFGLPACTTANGCFRKVDQNGGQAFPSQGPGWNSEISLDLDATSALCPHCNIVLVEANSSSGSDLVAAQAEAARLGANQITDSWGSPTSYVAPGPYTFPGVATVAAAGDDGYAGALNNQMPAALPDVTAAGGTDLIPASSSGIVNARGFTEQGWSGSGSGCDIQIARPAWQPATACGGRAYADLSANGNPDTGLAVYDAADGGWLLMGGTSEAAPLIAAYYAITGAGAATPAWGYQHSSLLNDASGGQSNGSCAIAILLICLAGPGYDGPTGTGSISGAVTPGAPGIGGPGPGGTYTRSTAANGAQLQAGIYPNSSDTTYSWQYGTSAAYGQATAPADAGAGQAPVTVSATLTGLAPGTTYHYRLVAQNAYGTTYGYDSTVTAKGSGAPRVSAVKATATGQRSAKLKATVDVQGGTATYHFVYGTGNSYRNRTATAAVSGGGTPVAATLTGLSPHTTYHVKLVANSAGGSAQSPVKTFTTGANTRLGGRRRGPRHPARHR